MASKTIFKIYTVPKKQTIKKKFTVGQQKVLQLEFQKNAFPNSQKISELSLLISEKVDKISEWFKNIRKQENQKSLLLTNKKTWFNGRDEKFLKAKFKECEHPNHQQYIKYANKVQGSLKHVKNWFANNRRKHAQASLQKKQQKKPEVTIIVIQGKSNENIQEKQNVEQIKIEGELTNNTNNQSLEVEKPQQNENNRCYYNQLDAKIFTEYKYASCYQKQYQPIQQMHPY